MSTQLLLIADTHWPKRAKALPLEVWRAVERADIVVHAGDWVGEGLLDELQARSRRLLACWGNNDGPEIRRRLPEVAHRTVEGARLAVVHETGAAAGREARMDRRYSGIDVLIFGHSHIPWDSVTPAGVRLLNPGSPTDRRRQPFATYMTATIAETATGPGVDVTLHRLRPTRT
ncbi:metallophosphoesterase [Georgenia halophila]|uniref:Phosphoesterase n=1 Tax=Georgenia halophila TaxID=620889 RepID=A0ABP8KSL6_9MICO